MKKNDPLNTSLIYIVVFISFIACTTNEEKRSNTVSEEIKQIPETINKEISSPDNIGPFQTPGDTFSSARITKVIKENHYTYETIPAGKGDMLMAIGDVVKKDTAFVPYFDTLKYNGVTVDYFTTIAKRLGGRPYFAENADSLVKSIIEILSTKLNNGTDVVLLIDKTGSMEDDLIKVKNSLDTIYKYISGFDNVKLAVASYGDKNYHLDFWYNRSELSTDKEILVNYMDSYRIMGNPDTPESVNDAIVKTVREMNWTEGNKRLMLVIGDAPSQLPPLSDYSTEEVISVCDSANVIFNLYPVILSLQGNLFYDPIIKSEPLKIYPNPADNYTTIKLSVSSGYWYEILDMTGKKVATGNFNGFDHKINLRDLSNGAYLIQAHNSGSTIYSTGKLLIQH